jgi:hypothetical protein
MVVGFAFPHACNVTQQIDPSAEVSEAYCGPETLPASSSYIISEIEAVW